MVLGVLLLVGRRLPVHDLAIRSSRPQEDQGSCCRQITGPAERDRRSRCGVYSHQVFEIAKRAAGIRPDVPDHRRARRQPGFRRRAAQAVGTIASAAPTSCSRSCRQKWNHDRRRARRRVPVSAAAGRAGAAAAVRDQDDRAVSEPERCRAGRCCEKAKASGMFWFVDTDLKIDKPQTDRRGRPRPGRDARADAAGCRQRARRGARRRLRQLLLDRRPLLQGDSAGAAERSAQSRAGARLLHQAPATARWSRHRRWRSIKTTVVPEVDQSLPAAQFGDDLGRDAGGVAGRGAAILAQCAARGRAVRLPDRLRGPVAPVRAGVGRLRRRRCCSRSSSCSWRWRRSSRASAIRS